MDADEDESECESADEHDCSLSTFSRRSCDISSALSLGDGDGNYRVVTFRQFPCDTGITTTEGTTRIRLAIIDCSFECRRGKQRQAEN